MEGGYETERTHKGTSVIDPRHPFDKWDLNTQMYHGYVYEVTGTRPVRGQDPGEWRIRNATVVRRRDDISDAVYRRLHPPSFEPSPRSESAGTQSVSGAMPKSAMEETPGGKSEIGEGRPAELEAILDELPWESLKEKAREIGVAVRGKKAQLAALIADTIRIKAGATKRTRMERDELKATEKAIREHPVYQAMIQGSQYVEADIDSGMENRQRRARVDPERVYFVEKRYQSEVEAYTGKPGEPGYDKGMGAQITYQKGNGQGWDDALAEQQIDLDLSGFLANLKDSVAAAKTDKAGILAGALERALESEDPSLLMLVEKRRLLEAKLGAYEINEAIHKIADQFNVEKGVYDDLLIARGLIANPNDPHPGAMTWEEFFGRLGQELADRNSDWLKRWNLPVPEKPREMYRRLRSEWEALRAVGLTEQLTLADVQTSTDLTPEQREELEQIDSQKVAAEILQKQKEILVGRLVSGVLDEEVQVGALRNAVIKAYKAGKIEGAAGKIEGAAAALEAYRWAREQQRANARLRDYIGKLLRYIKKPAGATIAMSERRAIALIQAQIDPHFRRKQTLDTRQASRDYFAAHPDTYVTPKTLELIQAKSPSEMTVQQLEEVKEQIRTLRLKGRIAERQRQEARHERLHTDTRAFLVALGRGDWTPDEPRPISDRPRESLGRRIRDLVGYTLTPERLFDALEGGKNFAGQIFRTMWDRVANQMSSELTEIKRRRDEVNAKLQELDLSLSDMNETVLTVRGEELSAQKAIGLYNFTRNLMSRLAITFGNHYSTADQTRIIEFVENEYPKLRELADWIVEHYDQNYERMRSATIEAFGMDPGREENYSPMRRMERDFVPDDRQIRQELEQRYHLKNAFVEHGFAIHRKDIPEEHQKPVRLDAVSLLFEQIEREEHEIAFAVLVKDLNSIIHDEDVKTAVLDKAGREGWQRIKNYIDAVANPNIYRTYNKLANMAQTMRLHASVAFLAYKLSTMMLQVPSVILYLPEAGHHLLVASWEAAANWDKVREFAVAKDPLLDHAVIEREYLELRDHSKEFAGGLKSLGEWGLKPLTAFDAVARTIGWYGTYLATYDAQIKQHKTEAEAEAEAVRVARHTTTRTQPGARAFELPEMYRTAEWLNVILQFTNQLNKMWNMTIHDMPKAWKNGNYPNAVAIFAALSINGLLTWAIQNRRLPEDEEDLLDALSEQFISTIPLMGTAWISYEHGFGGGEIPGIQGAAELAANVKDILASVVKGEIDEKAIAKAYRGLAPVVGLPYTGPKNVVKFVQTGDWHELLGGPPKKKKKKNSRSGRQR